MPGNKLRNNVVFQKKGNFRESYSKFSRQRRLVDVIERTRWACVIEEEESLYKVFTLLGITCSDEIER
jgi:hypothetical protein